MRRAIASLAMLAFLVATAAPALASCRMRAAQAECCCAPAPANTLCSLDCCASVKATRGLGHVSTPLRAILLLDSHCGTVFSRIDLAPRLVARPGRTLLVGLHERASPPLALRI